MSLTTADEWIRSAMLPRSPAAAQAFTELPTAERQAVQARIKAGLVHPDARVRSVAARCLETALIAEWPTERLSEHTLLELEEVFRRGRPMQSREPVPGCRCWDCTGEADPATRAADQGGITCPSCGYYRALVRGAVSAWYQCELCGTRSARSWPLDAAPDPDSLPRVRPRYLPRRSVSRRLSQRTLDVDAARRYPIRALAEDLGLEVNRAGWAHCPFHADSSPSLHLNTRKGAAFCNVCARSWDPIALLMELRGLSFPDAVRELTGERAA